jgi:hypothetical protein
MSELYRVDVYRSGAPANVESTVLFENFGEAKKFQDRMFALDGVANAEVLQVTADRTADDAFDALAPVYR